jgi:hypothetical protein
MIGSDFGSDVYLDEVWVKTTGAPCGNGSCEVNLGESCNTCPADCVCADDAGTTDNRHGDSQNHDLVQSDVVLTDSMVSDHVLADTATRVDAGYADGTGDDVAVGGVGEGCGCAVMVTKPTVFGLFVVFLALWRRR